MAFNGLTSSPDHQTSLLASDTDGGDRRLSFKQLIKLLLKFVLSLAVLMTLSLALYSSLWIGLQPNAPEFTIVSGAISKFEVRGPELSGHWTLDIQAHNPNFEGQVFDYLTLATFVSYNSEFPLAATHLHPFSQPGGNSTVFLAQAVASAQYLNDKVRGRLEKDLSRGVVEFDVDVAADYRYPCAYVVYASVGSVSCNRVKFELDVSGMNGTMVGAYPRTCKAGGNQRTAALKQMWFMVFVIAFVYLIIDVAM